MGATTPEGELFNQEAFTPSDGIVVINERCRIQTRGGYRVVTVSALPLAYYAVGDRAGEAHAMVSLVEQGWARQTEVAAAFGCDERTLRRHQRRFESGGLGALGRSNGYPKGSLRVPKSRISLVNQWKAQGVANREMARRLGVSEMAVRKLLGRLGWKSEPGEQLHLEVAESANPNLSGLQSPEDTVPTAATDNLPDMAAEKAHAGANPNLSGLQSPEETVPTAATDNLPDMAAGKASASANPNLSGLQSPEETVPAAATGNLPETAAGKVSAGANPNLSGFSPSAAETLPQSLDTDPANRSADRLLACLGLLDDAAPLFRPGNRVDGAGVLLAIPALIESGIFQIAAEIYGGIGPAFYGLRTTLLTALLMGLLRIKRPESLKEHSPGELGRLLGLDRAPEVKTLRKKFARLATFGYAADLGRALAQRRVAARGHAIGFLYVDGHVRAYHGKHRLPKAHLTRRRLAMPATTDYWINDREGDPLFVITTEANRGLVKMLPAILKEIRSLIGNRRLTVVFDRGGWSPKLFREIIAGGFDILTYRKGRCPRLPRSAFDLHEAVLDGRPLRYRLADTGIYLNYGPPHDRKRLHLRQVTRLDDGHQTPIITSRRDLSAIEVAYRMFERWRQENFFKYLMEEYALDALVDYGVEPADATRQIPNPERKKINAEIAKAYAELNEIAAEYGLEAFINLERARRTMRGFKIAHAPLGRQIQQALGRVAALEKKRSKIPTKVPVQEVTQGEVVKLRTERKHLTDLLKMVAYQAESDLVRLITPHYRRAEDEGRTLIQSALACAGDISVAGEELCVALEPMSSPHRTQILAMLCQELNESRTCYPGTKLRLNFAVKPSPEISPAFPGPHPRSTVSEFKPDISIRG
jgi:hypothetical protein